MIYLQNMFRRTKYKTDRTIIKRIQDKFRLHSAILINLQILEKKSEILKQSIDIGVDNKSLSILFVC